MKVRIKKSKYNHTWYAKMLGKTVEVERECSEFFWAREPAGHINIIFKDDVEVINEN